MLRSKRQVEEDRADKMSTIEDAVRDMIEKDFEDKKVYQTFLKDLIVQGLVRLLEKKVIVVVREQDKALVQEFLPQAEKEFSAYFKEHVKADVHTKLEICKSRVLNSDQSVLGGVW